MHSTTPQVRAEILRAARRVLVRDGAEHLTIASVAGEAGLSVGGLRYHFASKRDLLTALVDAMVERFDQALRNAPDEPGARTLAYISATLDAPQGAGDAAVGLIAAAAVDTSLLGPVRERYREWQALLEDDGLPPAVATAVRLAIDGWWFAALLDLAPPPARRAAEVRGLLEGLVTAARP